MRKLLGILFAGVLVITTVGTLLADQPDGINPTYGYVIVRCTVTIGINVIDEAATAYFGAQLSTNSALSCGQDAVSISSISVQNTGVGSICKWAIWYDQLQRYNPSDGGWVTDTDDTANGIKGWTIVGNSADVGICRMGLWMVFSTAPAQLSDFDVTIDSVCAQGPGNASTWKDGNAKYDCKTAARRYPQPSGFDSFATKAIPYYNAEEVAAWKSGRGMWFRVQTPTAVTDDLPRRVVIKIQAALLGSSW